MSNGIKINSGKIKFYKNSTELSAIETDKTGNININNNKIINVTYPTNDSDVATKKYVDDNKIYSFCLTALSITVICKDYLDLLYFPWSASTYANCNKIKLVFYTQIDNISFNIQLCNYNTEQVLGNLENIMETATHTIEIIRDLTDNLNVDTILSVRLKYSSNENIHKKEITYPIIYGVTLLIT